MQRRAAGAREGFISNQCIVAGICSMYCKWDLIVEGDVS